MYWLEGKPPSYSDNASNGRRSDNGPSGQMKPYRRSSSRTFGFFANLITFAHWTATLMSLCQLVPVKDGRASMWHVFFSSVSCFASGVFGICWYGILGLESTQIHYCQCYPAPLQLLQRGLFPCTPTAPTLAVDLKMLEFARELFLRVAPNNTAWCDTLESFLGGRRYKLTTRVSYQSDYILFLLMWWLN